MIEDVGLHRVPKRREFTVPIGLVFGVLFFFIFHVGMFVVLRKDYEEFRHSNSFLYLLAGIFLSVAMGKYCEILHWRKTWRDIAFSLGLNYSEYKSRWINFPQIKGVYKGVPLSMERTIKRIGNENSVSHTTLKLTLEGKSSDIIIIAPLRLISNIRRNFFGEERRYVKLGNENFDKKFSVRSTSEQAAKYILSSHSVQQGLLDIQSENSTMNIEIYGNELHYSEQEIIMDVNYLQAVIGVLIDVAQRIERYK